MSDGPNPSRFNACPECGAYRADLQPPYLHYPGCSKEPDRQIDRWVEALADQAAIRHLDPDA